MALNLALTGAREALGRGDARRALKALDPLVARGGDDFTFLSLRADALRLAGRWAEAGSVAAAALKLRPDSRRMGLVLATAQARLGQWDAAQAGYARVGMDAVASEMLAGALSAWGRHEEAERVLVEALAARPGDTRLLSAIGHLRWMRGDAQTFVAPVLAALQVSPGDAGLCLLAADLLRRADRPDEALAILERSPARGPEMASARALMLSHKGRHAEALALSAQAAPGAPPQGWIARNHVCIALAAGQGALALAGCAAGLAVDAHDQEWLALQSVALRLIGQGRPGSGWLDPPEPFVGVFRLPVPPGFASLDDYLAALGRRLRELHGLQAHPLDQSLRGGTQLPLDRLRETEPLVAAFFVAIGAPVAAYRERVGFEAGHPFRGRNRGEVEVTGAWSVRLRTGGSHVNHIHPEGWISSAFYVDVPETMTRADNSREGWLHFGEPRFAVPGVEALHSVRPVAGELVLFPSCLWHGVKPFHDGQERLTLAFDLVPA